MELPKGILIAGAAKSGTTALFFAVKNALLQQGVAVEGLFEPRLVSQAAAYARETADAVPVVKMLLVNVLRSRRDFAGLFDKRILIYRDPRDNVVSRLHFMCQRFFRMHQTAEIEALIELFRRKEMSPGSVSVLEVTRAMEQMSGRAALKEDLRSNALLPVRLVDGGDFFKLPYADFVDGRLEALGAYLGLPVPADFHLPDSHRRVERAKRTGAWKDWFLEEDVQFFARDVAAELNALGFDPDEQPHDERRIDPATGSAYVAALYRGKEERRRQGKARRQAAKRAGDPQDEREDERRRRRRECRALNPR